MGVQRSDWSFGGGDDLWGNAGKILKEAKLRTDRKIDEVMGLVLRTGVILAAAIVLIGGVVYLTRHPGTVRDYRVFEGEPVEYRSVAAIAHEALELRARGLIQLGLLVLIATPI